MFHALRAFFRDLRDPHVPLSDVLKETRPKLAAAMKVDPKEPARALSSPRVLFDKPMPSCPTRDEARLAYAEAENLAAWLQHEQELKAAQPKPASKVTLFQKTRTGR